MHLVALTFEEDNSSKFNWWMNYIAKISANLKSKWNYDRLEITVMKFVQRLEVTVATVQTVLSIVVRQIACSNITFNTQHWLSIHDFIAFVIQFLCSCARYLHVYNWFLLLNVNSS